MTSVLGPRHVRQPLAVAVKICGVTREEDVHASLHLGAALIGLNFYTKSPRHLDLEQARRLRHAIGDRALAVGVFVDPEPEEVAAIDRVLNLDLLQFHGQEPLEQLEPHAQRAIRVLRPEHQLEADALDPYANFWGVLFDTPPPRQGEDTHGGTGQTWRYDRIAACLKGNNAQPRILLAGGLRPETVANVLQELPGIWGLDICSGVETSPGIKDPKMLRTLFEALKTQP